jgi:hypothetical protein
MAVGGLMAALCGTCTLVAATFGIASGDGAADILLLLTYTAIGGVPTVLGALIFHQGLKLWRSARSGP